jgi:hypothetical protein
MKNLTMFALVLAGLFAGSTGQCKITFGREVPDEVKTKVVNDLAFVGTIQGSQQSPMNKEIYGKVEGQTYLDWFAHRISTFGYDSRDTSGGIAYNDSIMGHQNNMMVTNYYVKGDLPQVARIMVVFHEARHSERAARYWMHVRCPSPFKDDSGKDVTSIYSGLPLAGQPACDRTSEGAYGASTVMIENIARFCANCTDKIKMDAELYGDDQAHRITAQAEFQKLITDSHAVTP